MTAPPRGAPRGGSAPAGGSDPAGPDGWHLATVAAAGRRRGRLLALHGFAEHGGRYRAFAEGCAARGLEVVLPDLPGHGRSAGPRGLIDDAEGLATELAARLADLRAAGAPVAAFGHSFGGALLLRAAQLRPDALDALAVSAPYLASARRDPPWLLRLATAASRVAPRLRSLPIDAAVVSRLDDQVAAYEDDPLVDRGGVRLASVRELHQLGPRVLADAGALRTPTLIVHGDDDRLADVAGSRALAATAPTARLHEIPGGAHALLHDRAADQAGRRVVEWLVARLAEAPLSSGPAAAAGT
jgi:alpha-beta hydrolase superfamily lysophospholipase